MNSKRRAKRFEGSFGKEKEHYQLKKDQSKDQRKGNTWIFFGIQTVNALEIGGRMVDVYQNLATNKKSF